jgi:hypothetical protein
VAETKLLAGPGDAQLPLLGLERIGPHQGNQTNTDKLKKQKTESRNSVLLPEGHAEQTTRKMK